MTSVVKQPGSGALVLAGRELNSSFPLAASSNGRFLRTSSSTPFLVVGDAAWSAEVQLTTAQIDTYLDDRQARGFTAILVECIERLYSSQTPHYRNAQSGADPFTTMSPVAWTSPNETYWQTVDYLVNGCKSRDMACFMTPAYMGFNNNANGDGWVTDTDAATGADLQTYGAFLANRYTQGNVVWVMGGDYAGTTTQRDKQWNIATGIRSVNSSALIIGHPARSDGDGYSLWGPGGQNYTGWNLNTVYALPADIVSESATAYGRSGPVPAINLEAYYEGEHSTTTNDQAVQALQSFLSGCCGYFFGNSPIWGFGEPSANGGGGAAAALAGSLNTAGAQTMGYIATLLKSYSWHMLVPKTDASLVSSSLGTGTAAVCPALASDGSFALIHKNDANSITVVMSVFSKSSVRARWYDPAAGTFSSVAGSPFANSGSQTISHPGNNASGGTCWCLVMD